MEDGDLWMETILFSKAVHQYSVILSTVPMHFARLGETKPPTPSRLNVKSLQGLFSRLLCNWCIWNLDIGEIVLSNGVDSEGV
ncbi:hypothetical protein TESG_03504 [Trichophyton tonsurans CBS 112818]|uniref:Uncharacterized protein n=1 Tax=Trichophyton tonsurans (strain CBS 112818) TaxID=647933 RepID=F2RXJ4_TRIT1|nr:hypothetical protein TESG_03504 [Trichophyton tonsurans CBS 112818]